MATLTIGVHLHERDASGITAVNLATTVAIDLTPDVTIYCGSSPDEQALVLANIRRACEEGIALIGAKPEPQPGAGAEYGMEAERG